MNKSNISNLYFVSCINSIIRNLYFLKFWGLLYFVYFVLIYIYIYTYTCRSLTVWEATEGRGDQGNHGRPPGGHGLEDTEASPCAQILAPDR